MSVERAGIELIAEGASAFFDTLDEVNDAYIDMADQLGDVTDAMSDFSSVLAEIGTEQTSLAGTSEDVGISINKSAPTRSTLSSIKSAVSFLGDLGNAFTLVQKVVGGIIQGIQKVGGAFIELGRSGAVFEGLAKGFDGFTSSLEGGARRVLSAMQDASSGTIANRDLFQQFNTAASLVSKDFAQTLPDAMQHFSKIAAATGASVDFLLDSYVKGVGRIQPLILDNLQVQITLAQITARAAEMFNVAADSTTKYQQQMAAAALTTEQMGINTAGMADVADTAQASIQRMGAGFTNIRDTVSQALMPAFTASASALSNLVMTFSSAISEGGSLFPILTNIGAAASIMADALAQGVNTAAFWLENLGIVATEVSETTVAGLDDMRTQSVDTMEEMGTEITSVAQGLVDSALDWGTNIATSFAQGMIDGAVAAISAAMNFISGMLSAWLSPGSPPKVAPNLTTWGHGAIGEFFLGMTQGDLGILQGIQGQLKAVLSPEQFAGVTADLAKAFAGGDRAGAFDAIAESAGTFTDDLHRVLAAQFAVADAEAELEAIQARSIALTGQRIAAEAQLESVLDGVKSAQDALRQSIEGATDAQDEVSRRTKEYNALLKSGASQEQLDVQLKLINAAEAQRDAQLGQVNAAEDAVAAQTGLVDAAEEQLAAAEIAEDAALAQQKAEEDAASQRLEDLRAELAFQQSVAKQLIDLAKIRLAVAPEDADAEATLVGKAVKGKAIAIPEIKPPPVANIAGGIATAFADAVDLVKGPLQEKFGELWQGLVTSIGVAFEPLKEKWDEIVALAVRVWETELLPFWEDDLKPAIDTLIETFAKISTWWDENGPEIMRIVGEVFGDTIELIADLAGRVIPWVIEQFVKVSDWFIDNEDFFITILEAFGEAWSFVSGLIVEFWDLVEPIFTGIINTILNVGSTAIALMEGDWDKAWESAKKIVTDQVDAAKEVLVGLMDFVLALLGSETWQEIEAQWLANWDLFKTIVATAGQAIIDSLFGESGLVAQIGDAIAGAWEQFLSWGNFVVEGIIQGIKLAAHKVKNEIAKLWGGAEEETKDATETGSPSRLYQRYGQWIGEGAIKGLNDVAGQVQRTTANLFQGGGTQPIPQQAGFNDLVSAIDGRGLQPVPSSSSVTINIGPNTIQGMDDRVFFARVENAVRGALRSRV